MERAIHGKAIHEEVKEDSSRTNEIYEPADTGCPI